MTNRLIIPEGPKAGRQRCCIIGCQRTIRDRGALAWICGAHFAMGPARLRKFLRRIEAKMRKVGPREDLKARHDRAWDLLVRAVQDSSLGISGHE